MDRHSFIQIAVLFFFSFGAPRISAQQPTVAREWSEAVLYAMQGDLARPAVQSRNFFHFSIALYDAWAAYDTVAQPYLLGKALIAGQTCPFSGIPQPTDVEAARKEAMSFAAYRFLSARFIHSPEGSGATQRFKEIMAKHGYDFHNLSTQYSTGSPAALGNHIAQCVLQLAQRDGSNEHDNHLYPEYQPVNPPLQVFEPGPAPIRDPNRWQPLKVKHAIDKDGYPMAECRCGGSPMWMLIDSVDRNGRLITGTQTCQAPMWGQVKPFALKKQDQKIFRRKTLVYRLYHDPGSFLPRLDTVQGGGTSSDFIANFSLVAAWSAFLDPADGVLWEVSPGSMGNVQQYPRSMAELPDFYNLQTGRDPGAGHPLNPRTGRPYTPQKVPRGDFIRVAVQYWAEGPNQETPAGNWLTLLNYVSDQPGLAKRFNGKGPVMSDLEWDVKAYFLLAGALHDAAISAWGIKGWYDTARPVTALRYLAARGQSTDPQQPSYHPAGIRLIPGRIELIKKGDPLAGSANEHLGKIKYFAWKGTPGREDSTTQKGGVGWILAENWRPYQPKSFVTPPSGGFVSGHAVLSHAAAEALTLLTGDPYFPGGLGEYAVKANSDFLRIEKGPGVDVSLQWATYRDAADQASLSRIWCGVVTPFDDMPGRTIGMETGKSAFQLAKTYFYKDRDGDGYLNYEDRDDQDAAVW